MKKFMLRRLGVAHDAHSVKPTLQSCIETVLDHSPALMDEVLSGLLLSLAPTQNKSLHSHQNPASQSAIEALCSQGAAVQLTFVTALRNAVYGKVQVRGSAGAAQVRFDDFQFLEEEQIDANIQRALTEQEVLLAVSAVLPTLNALMSTLLGWVTVHAHLNPLKPESFVHALSHTLMCHVPDEKARSGLMIPSAGLLGNSLQQLYRELVDWLRSQGVEPAGPTGASGFGVAAKAGDSSMTRSLLTLDKLRKLLSGELELGPQAAGGADFTHTIPASFVALEDLKLLEPMMQRLAARAKQSHGAKVATATVARVGQEVHREPTQGRYLGHQLGEEVVRLMLENLMQDRRLPPKMRQALSSMESLLVKLSRSDARFFTERAHPARQFLDKLTHRSLGFTSQEEPGFADFMAAFEQALSELGRTEADAAAFAQVLAQLEAFWARIEYDQRQRAEESARALLHAEQRNLLAQRLAQDFATRLENKTVPEIVSAFLRGPWAQVVAESQLRCVDGAVDADGYLALVDDLIWSVRLRLARRNRTRLVQLVPGMLIKLRKGLTLISYPEERMAVFFDELISIHEKAFDSPRPAPVQEEAASATKLEAAMHSVSPQPDAPWMAEEEAADSGYLDDILGIAEGADDLPELPDSLDGASWSADSLNIGSWVDLALGGQWVRAELTWASPHRSLFMFISGGGLAHSMSRRTLDRLRALALIRLVSDGRVMDNALDAVAQTALRNDMARPDSP